MSQSSLSVYIIFLLVTGVSIACGEDSNSEGTLRKDYVSAINDGLAEDGPLMPIKKDERSGTKLRHDAVKDFALQISSGEEEEKNLNLIGVYPSIMISADVGNFRHLFDCDTERQILAVIDFHRSHLNSRAVGRWQPVLAFAYESSWYKNCDDRIHKSKLETLIASRNLYEKSGWSLAARRVDDEIMQRAKEPTYVE